MFMILKFIRCWGNDIDKCKEFKWINDEKNKITIKDDDKNKIWINIRICYITLCINRKMLDYQKDATKISKYSTDM